MLSFVSTCAHALGVSARRVTPGHLTRLPAARPHVPTRPASTFLGKQRAFVIGSALLVLSGGSSIFHRAHTDSSTRSPAAATTTMSLSDLVGLKDIDGKEVDSAIFHNKVVFAMNVASACGYTQPGYELFKRLTERFAPADFVAVAIPCNSFGWQENGSPEDIKMFALGKAEKLVVMERSLVNGGDLHPIVNLAKEKFPGRIKWNFDGRFVFDRQGVPVARFGNSASPEEIESAIEACL